MLKITKSIGIDYNLAMAVDLFAKKKGIKFSKVVIWAIYCYLKEHTKNDADIQEHLRKFNENE
ncbi:hypothetical protein phi1422_0024 [Bdellovibrio phage phi1422]|uniref:hypothetical protein n=1 Tax=Bdellovibrio phage phi1422 TaxID=1127515 RepID=UPI0002536D4C|nr:hypothetical protein F395_gp24 [Bdellovibrio phage phi1422]AFC22544.1 hypothetical protein phi1422_0024 [Bdellovibrio phage phi1422]